MKKKACVLVLAVVTLSGCIVGETDHGIVIEGDGSVSWMVLERQVRSNAEESGERTSEEQAFLDELRRGEHPVEQAFRRLGAESVDLQLLRDRRPFAVWTEARFASVESLAWELVNQLGLEGEVKYRDDGELHRLEVLIDPSTFEGELEDEAVRALVDELSSYRVFINEGRFLATEGFEIVDDGMTAIPIERSEDQEESPLRLTLEWTVRS